MTQAVADVLAGVDQSVAALEAMPAFPTAYVATVRAAVRRLDPFPPGPMDVPQAIALVTQQARIDVDVPLRTRRPGARMVKIAIKRVTAWYLDYLAEQAGDLGQAVVRMGAALAERLSEVQAQVGHDRAATEAEIALLRARIAALEAAARGTQPVAPEAGTPRRGPGAPETTAIEPMPTPHGGSQSSAAPTATPKAGSQPPPAPTATPKAGSQPPAGGPDPKQPRRAKTFTPSDG